MLLNNMKSYNLVRRFVRTLSTTCVTRARGLLLGAVKREDNDSQLELTVAAQAFDSSINGRLSELLKITPINENREGVLFHGLHENYPVVYMAKIDRAPVSGESLENINEEKESIRKAIAAGIKELKASNLYEIEIDPCTDAKAAAEGAHLALYSFEELKSTKNEKEKIQLILTEYSGGCQQEKMNWNFGSILAESQNFARRLMDRPSNLMTPKIFASCVEQAMVNLNNVKVITRDEDWARKMKMNSFLGVSQGSQQSPVFLEVHYSGAKSGDNDKANTLVLVGKGVTFDSGGISIKPAANMGLMKGDMGGAAVTMGALYAVTKLNLPLNVIGLTPLCENMPSGSAMKPGDVLRAMNGKTIEVDNTDAEGRLILGDALTYAHTFNPTTLINIATLTGAVNVALGSGAAGVFTNSKKLWQELYDCSWRTGDRVWRLPLYDVYTKQIKSDIADIRNIGKYQGSAGACTAAAFLKEFIDVSRWAHIDIAGVMSSEGDYPSYLSRGMTGRPTRTIVEFARNLSDSTLD